ncbi:MAG: hypothetical protein AB7R00_01780 [Kofleriaceae bacterium]
MSFPAPPMPTFPEGQAATTTRNLRYEDLTQDGRIVPSSLQASLPELWTAVLVRHPGQRAAVAAGIVPVLTRMTLCSFDQPIRIDRPLESSSGFQLCHEREHGEVSRLFLNVWCEVRGTAGRIGPRQTDRDAVTAGSMFAEHTFTKLFAPPDQRRVTRLGFEGYPEVPEAQYAAPPATSPQELPDGARWLDELAADPVDMWFTLDQTDSNQHVNSLVYVRMFGDAVQRRLAAGKQPLKIRTKAVEITYRKPSFVGECARAHVRLFEYQDQLGAAGFVAGDDGKPRSYIRVLLGP